MEQMMTIQMYRPEYNPETKKYEDYNPIPLRAKGYHYRCSCIHNDKTFTKSSEFTQHFKSKSHRDFVAHYENNTRDLIDATERIKQLQIIIGKQYHLILQLQKTVSKPIDYLSNLELD